MSPAPDDFEQLRRLLALKRYEQPPPGYFHGFSRQVIVRIKAGELGNDSEVTLWSFGAGSLFQRMWATLDARPVFAGAFGVAVCGFFVVGALLSDGATAANNNSFPQPPRPPVARVWQQETDRQISSTIGVAVPNYQPPTSSLFDEITYAQQNPNNLQRARPEQVDFRFPVIAP